jgi:hypothetical protein
MSAAGFEPAIPTSERPETYAATGIEPSLISDPRIFKELRTLGSCKQTASCVTFVKIKKRLQAEKVWGPRGI